MRSRPRFGPASCRSCTSSWADHAAPARTARVELAHVGDARRDRRYPRCVGSRLVVSVHFEASIVRRGDRVGGGAVTGRVLCRGRGAVRGECTGGRRARGATKGARARPRRGGSRARSEGDRGLDRPHRCALTGQLVAPIPVARSALLLATVPRVGRRQPGSSRGRITSGRSPSSRRDSQGPRARRPTGRSRSSPTPDVTGPTRRGRAHAESPRAR